MSDIIFQKNGVYVTKHSIAQDRSASKEMLFVDSEGYNFGVFQIHEMTRAIDAAINVANIPAAERREHRR